MGRGKRAGKPAKRPAKRTLKEKRQAKHDKHDANQRPEFLGEHKRQS